MGRKELSPTCELLRNRFELGYIGGAKLRKFGVALVPRAM